MVGCVKILDVTEFYSERGGGVRCHLTLKAERLAARGIEHRVIAPGPRDEVVTIFPRREISRASAVAPALALRFRGPAMPYDPSYHVLWQVAAVRAAIVAERPDVLEINSPYLAALAALSVPSSSFGIRTFFWHADFIHTYLGSLASGRLTGSLANLMAEPLWSMVRRIAAACSATIVTSRVQAARLESNRVPRVRYLPLGIDADTFAPSRRDEVVRRRWLGDGYESAALVVGVGRFAIEKHWDLVIEACARVRRARDVVLVLFGDGPERARLERRVRELGLADTVRFAGFVRDRPRLAAAIASADLFVHGCPFETFGLSVAEAVSCGVPVVVPDAGGAAEIVTDYARGASSATYAAGSATACAAAMLELLGRPRAAVRDGALAASRRAPTIDSHFDRVLELYQELFSRHAVLVA